MDPFTIATVASSVLNLFGGMDEAAQKKKQQQIANGFIKRILPVQHDQFNTRYGLTNTVNNLLLGNEANRYNQVGGAEVANRNAVGDESVARFDDQTDAVHQQITDNTAHADQLIAAIGAAIHGSTNAYNAERGRQLGYQGTADTAAQALIPQVGSAADAAARTASLADRTALADTTIGAADTGGNTLPAHSRIAAEFAKRGMEARDTAMGTATANADVGSYGDARSGTDRTISDFVQAMDNIKTQATSSAGALRPELAAFTRAGDNAQSEFEGQGALTNLIAGGTVRNRDAFHSGNITAINDAGDANVGSLSDMFARLSNAWQTGYGGQVNASQRYEDNFTNLMNNAANRVLGQTVSSPLTGLGSFIGGLKGIMPGGPGG